MDTNLSHIPDFRSPWWCYNGHVHTIACSLFGDTDQPECRRIEISTPDGDFLELDVRFQKKSDAVIALFHGLEGSSKRYYMVESMRSLVESGFSVVAVNFRSCGSRLNNKRRFYHSGETSDYATVFKWIENEMPDQKLGAVGFSLGANALLKSLGEERGRHPLDASVAVSAPYDLKLGSLQLSRGFNRVYEYRFLRTLRKKLNQKRKRFPDLPRLSGTTLYEFDDKVTAPIHGFKDADDYYESCSARYFLKDIRKPTLLIHSKEDPLCPVDGLPLQTVKENRALDYIITGEGGHVGFYSTQEDWLNNTIRNYLVQKLL